MQTKLEDCGGCGWFFEDEDGARCLLCLELVSPNNAACEDFESNDMSRIPEAD